MLADLRFNGLPVLRCSFCHPTLPLLSPHTLRDDYPRDAVNPWQFCFLGRVLLLNFDRMLDSLQPSSNSTTAAGGKGISGTDEGRLLCSLGPLGKLALARKLTWKFSEVSVSVECDTSWACI